jgi:hypothetical protein
MCHTRLKIFIHFFLPFCIQKKKIIRLSGPNFKNLETLPKNYFLKLTQIQTKKREPKTTFLVLLVLFPKLKFLSSNLKILRNGQVRELFFLIQIRREPIPKY